jgi:hypothetical protein
VISLCFEGFFYCFFEIAAAPPFAKCSAADLIYGHDHGVDRADTKVDKKRTVLLNFVYRRTQIQRLRTTK